MDDLRVIVRIIERVTKLSRPDSNLIRLKDFLFFFSSQVRERFAIDVLNRNAAGAIVVYEVVNPNDVRMSQFEAALCLTLELIKHSPVLNHQVGDKFQRNIALQFFVACQPDNSHSAAPKDLDQRVAAKDSLPPGELTRRRRCDTARALVSHLDRVYIIKVGRKSKAGVRSLFGFAPGGRSSSLQIRHFASTMTFW